MQKLADAEVVILVYCSGCNCVLCALLYKARAPFHPAFDKLNLRR